MSNFQLFMSWQGAIFISMEVEVLATLLGVTLAALVAACGAGFRWLRVDFRDLRNHVESRFNEQAMVTNARFVEVNGRLDRLEHKVDRLEHKFDRLEHKVDRLERKFDDLIIALARTGLPIEARPAAPEPPPVPGTAAPPPESAAAAQSPESASGPTEAPADGSLQAAPPPEISDLPRAPPATGGQPTAERPYRPPPPEPFGPTVAPA